MELNNNNTNQLIIGSGMLFPIEITSNGDGKTGWYPSQGDQRLIENNIETLLLYQIGQKFRGENFGTRLWECIEEGNSQAQNYLINNFIKEALSTWEDRITYKSTTMVREGSRLKISFTYNINGTSYSNVGTMVYNSLNDTLNI